MIIDSLNKICFGNIHNKWFLRSLCQHQKGGEKTRILIIEKKWNNLSKILQEKDIQGQ